MADDDLLLPSLREEKEPDVWDGDWRRISYDPLTGVSEWHMFEAGATPSQDKTHVRLCQEGAHIQAVLDHNETLMNCGDGGWIEGEKLFKRVGSIPLGVLHKYSKQGINLLSEEHEKEREKLFNDIDYRKLRTAPGRI